MNKLIADKNEKMHSLSLDHVFLLSVYIYNIQLLFQPSVFLEILVFLLLDVTVTRD